MTGLSLPYLYIVGTCRVPAGVEVTTFQGSELTPRL